MSNIIVMSKPYSDERAIVDVINYVLTGMEEDQQNMLQV